MDVFELRNNLREMYVKNMSSGVKAKYILDYAEDYILQRKEKYIPIIDIYNNLDIEVSYQWFQRVIKKRWNISSKNKKGVKLLLNVTDRKDV